MNQTAKVAKLIPRLQILVAGMDCRNDLVMHQRVDQFYYMQKTEELKELLEQLEELHRKLEHLAQRAEATYTEVFNRWQKDARWLRRYTDEKVNPIRQTKSIGN